MTRRDLQFKARDMGRPWDFGKAFDESAPIGAPSFRWRSHGHPSTGTIELEVNGEMRQTGRSGGHDLVRAGNHRVSCPSTTGRKPGDLIYHRHAGGRGCGEARRAAARGRVGAAPRHARNRDGHVLAQSGSGPTRTCKHQGDGRKTWLEVALNGPWDAPAQPRIPVTVKEIVEEGIACVKAGAAIVHAHAYDEATGTQNDDWELYARIITGIRGQVDAIVYPTHAGRRRRASRPAQTPQQRFAPCRGTRAARTASSGRWSIRARSTSRTTTTCARTRRGSSTQPGRADPARPGPGSARRASIPLCDLRAGLPAPGRHAALAREHADTGLPVHVLVRLQLRLSAGGLRLTAYLNLMDHVAPGA